MHSTVMKKPLQIIPPENTGSATAQPLIVPEGFREYDARWWYGTDGQAADAQINLAGVEQVGLGLAFLLRQRGLPLDIVVGHDFRSYSADIKIALIAGLISGGAQVVDIGLALSPMAYYAQFALNCQSVVMVTASHNENGWTGLKIGCDRPVTFGPQDMAELRAVVMSGVARPAGGGSYRVAETLSERYCGALIHGMVAKRKLKLVIAAGNGTAGFFAPHLFRALGYEVVELDCKPDWTFPHYNPDPEAAPMQKAMRAAVQASGADLAFGFDGDGDRCGMVDHEGNVLFADRIGLLLARQYARDHQNAHFIVDVKSTALFGDDPVLRQYGATVEYWKTGHSHIKRRMRETGALAAFEKSGHMFFAEPLGLGYDDGLAAALAVCALLEASPQQSLADLHRHLPVTYATPAIAVPCSDFRKYDYVRHCTGLVNDHIKAGHNFAGQTIAGHLEINGSRITLADGTWGLIRASSNKPELVLVAESPVSPMRRDAMLMALKTLIMIVATAMTVSDDENMPPIKT